MSPVASINLVGTGVSAAGIESFIAATPSVREVVLSVGQISAHDLTRIRAAWPQTEIRET
jgi:hypothetical protein